MTIAEYLAATLLTTLIVWAVFGAANAGKLSGANLPYYGRDDFNFFAPLPLNSVTKLN